MVKQGLFSHAYVEYSVDCPELKKSTIRKQTDIQWYKDKLEQLFPTTYFPPLPKSSIFQANQKNCAPETIAELNKFFDSLLQSEIVRSTDLTRDFISLTQNEFETRKKNVYEKLTKPQNIRDFSTMDGYVDIRENPKIESQILGIGPDIGEKANAYSNLISCLNSLAKAYENVQDKLRDVSNAYKNLSVAYKNKINSDNIISCMDKFSRITGEWSEGYKNQVKYLNDEMVEFFKYISREVEEFKLVYDEFYQAKQDVEKKSYLLKKAKSEGQNMDEVNKSHINAKIVYGFILNRAYDEYIRLNNYHSKIIKEKLEKMDENKKLLLIDYEHLVKLFSLK